MSEEHKCPNCDRVLGSKGALTQHVRKEHGDDSLSEITAEFGEMAPRPGGAWRVDRPLSAAPSGVPSIDYAIGIGGVPRGTLIEVFGPSASGKTFVALTFSAYAQKQGEKAGYADAEHALQPTFAQLIPDLDLDELYYTAPRGGEETLEISRRFIQSGEFGIWTVDSVHALVPQAMLDKKIGENTMSELAKLMSNACQVLDHVISDTNTVCIFVNHVKAIPAVTHGKDWFKPGGSALDYYASIALMVRPVALFNDKNGRRIGHTVKVKVEKSKVAAPFASAEFDLFYRPGTIKKDKHAMDGVVVEKTGIDMGSCWFSVCMEAGLIRVAGGRYFDADTGETLGYRREIVELLEADCELRRKAEQEVYGGYATRAIGATTS